MIDAILDVKESLTKNWNNIYGLYDNYGLKAIILN